MLEKSQKQLLLLKTLAAEMIEFRAILSEDLKWTKKIIIELVSALPKTAFLFLWSKNLVTAQ